MEIRQSCWIILKHGPRLCAALSLSCKLTAVRMHWRMVEPVAPVSAVFRRHGPLFATRPRQQGPHQGVYVCDSSYAADRSSTCLLYPNGGIRHSPYPAPHVYASPKSVRGLKSPPRSTSWTCRSSAGGRYTNMGCTPR